MVQNPNWRSLAALAKALLLHSAKAWPKFNPQNFVVFDRLG
jgi:hypothetical protein